MRDTLMKRVLPISLLFSLILHFLFLMIIAFMSFSFPVKKEKLPDLYQSAYLYQGSLAPTTSAKKSSILPASQEIKQVSQPVTETVSKNALSLGKRAKKQIAHQARSQSVMSMTYQFLQQYQHESMASSEEDEEPIYLVGDMNSPVNPLIRLLGRALSAHFAYPRAAGEFGIRGRAIVSLVLHPSGELSDIKLLQSTENQDLDAAALYAANSAPIVKGVDKFLQKPKRFVVGFIFR